MNTFFESFQTSVNDFIFPSYPHTTVIIGSQLELSIFVYEFDLIILTAFISTSVLKKIAHFYKISAPTYQTTRYQNTY